MGKYRKRPVVIEATRLGNIHRSESAKSDFERWAAEHGFSQAGKNSSTHWWWDWDGVHILTPEGEMAARVGDWIIKGIEGEFYPCRDSIFAATYEAVDA